MRGCPYGNIFYDHWNCLRFLEIGARRDDILNPGQQKGRQMKEKTSEKITLLSTTIGFSGPQL